MGRAPSRRPAVLVAVGLLAVIALAAGVTAVGSAVEAGPADRSETGCASGLGVPHEQSLVSMSIFVAPNDAYGRLTNASALAAARADGTLTRPSGGDDETPQIRYRSTAVHRVELDDSTRDLLDRLVAQGRASPTENFRALLDDDIGLRGRGASCGRFLNVDESIDRNAIRAVPDRANDTLSLVFDVERLAFGRGYDDRYYRYKQSLSVAFSVYPDSGLVSSTERDSSYYSFEGPYAGVVDRTSGERVVQATASEDWTIAGYTSLERGSEARIRMRAVDDSTVLVNRTVDVTDQSDRRANSNDNDENWFRAVVNTSGVDPGTEFELTVHHDGELIGTERAVVDQTAEVATDEVDTDGSGVATVPIDVRPGRWATVVVTGEDRPYRRLARVRDRSGDGRVDLRVDETRAVRRVGPTDVYDVGSGDELRVTGANRTGTFGTGEYTIAAYPGTGTRGEPSDSASMEIVLPERGTAETFVAPAWGFDRLTDRQSLRTAREEGWLTPADSVARGDTLVYRLGIPDIERILADQSGGTDDERLRSLLDRSDSWVSAVEVEPESETPRREVRLDDRSASRVVADSASDTYYLVVDTGDVPVEFRQSMDVDASLQSHEVYVPRVVVGDQARVNPDGVESDTPRGAVGAHDANAAVERWNATNTVTLRPAENRSIAGITTLAPGSNVTVRLVNGGSEAFPLTRTVRVSPEGDDRGDGQTVSQRSAPDPPAYGFTVAVDASGVEPGAPFTVEVSSNGTLLQEEVDGIVTSRNASVRFPSGGAFGAENVTVRDAILPDGGFVVVRLASGPVLAVSDYLEPGTHENITLDRRPGFDLNASDATAVAVAVRDRDENRRYEEGADRAYYVGRSNATDETDVPAVVSDGADDSPSTPGTETGTTDSNSTATPSTSTATPSTPTATSSSPTAASSTPTATAVPSRTDPTESGGPAGTGTDADGPGFHVAGAVLALALALVLGRRARNRAE